MRLITILWKYLFWTTFLDKINRNIINYNSCNIYIFLSIKNVEFQIFRYLIKNRKWKKFVIFSFNGYDLLIAKHVQLTIVALYTQKCCFLLQTLIYQPFIRPLRVMLGYFKCYLPNIYYLTQVKILWKVTLLIEEFDKQ